MPYADPEKRRITHNECCKRWRERSKKRYLAQKAVSNAVASGRLVPWPGCAACRRKRNLHAHHCDYDAPLDVVWLCVKCHKAAHAIVGFVNTDPEREHVHRGRRAEATAPEAEVSSEAAPVLRMREA